MEEYYKFTEYDGRELNRSIQEDWHEKAEAELKELLANSDFIVFDWDFGEMHPAANLEYMNTHRGPGVQWKSKSDMTYYYNIRGGYKKVTE